MESLKTVLVILVISILFGCEQQADCNIHFTISSGENLKVYLTKVPFLKEKEVIIDSQICTAGKEIMFKIYKNENDAQYKIKLQKSRKEFYFFADSKNVFISVNNTIGQMVVIGSSATNALLNFQKEQKFLIDSAKQISKNLSSNYNTINKEKDSKKFDSLEAFINQQYINYADTVSNSGLFIYVYNLVNFGDNYKLAMAILSSAKKRFPNSLKVENLFKKGKKTMDIYAYELQVGDMFPTISLPDISNNLFSTASLQNQYYFIDFWSTWCTRCKLYDNRKLQLFKTINQSNFKMVSVALDDDPVLVRSAVVSQKMNWIQLVDTAMWEGVAANTIKFDSIPMNYLINSNGKIIGKSIPADSLAYYFSHYVVNP